MKSSVQNLDQGNKYVKILGVFFLIIPTLFLLINERLRTRSHLVHLAHLHEESKSKHLIAINDILGEQEITSIDGSTNSIPNLRGHLDRLKHRRREAHAELSMGRPSLREAHAELSMGRPSLERNDGMGRPSLERNDGMGRPSLERNDGMGRPSLDRNDGDLLHGSNIRENDSNQRKDHALPNMSFQDFRAYHASRKHKNRIENISMPMESAPPAFANSHLERGVDFRSALKMHKSKLRGFSTAQSPIL